MKRFVLSVFLLFAGLSIFAQSYDDWNKLFTEYKGGTAESRLRYIGSLLPYDKEHEEMARIFFLYDMKHEMSNKASLDDKLYYNQCYDNSVNQFSDFKSNTETFIKYLSDNKLNAYDVKNLDIFDLRTEYKEIVGRELQLLPSKFRNKKIYFEARYENVDRGYANFVYYDSVDSQFKNIGVKYTEEAAELLLNIKKGRYYTSNYYNLYGTVENGFFVIEYLEHL